MMIKRILMVCAALAAGAAGTSIALAQGYPAPPPGGSYSAAPYPPGGYPPDYRRGPGMIDDADDEDSQYGLSSTALPPPGPVMSPDDPRYGRPMGTGMGAGMGSDPAGAPPVYSDRNMPTGPVMSPDDPRYGRPDITSLPVYPDRGNGGPRPPGSGDANSGLRPPEGVGARTAPGAPAPDGSPMVLSALPADEQPDAGPTELAPNLRRQEVAFNTKEPPGTLIVDTPNTYLYYVLGGGRAIRYGVRVGRDGFTWNGVQKITRKAEWPDWHPPSEMIDRQPYLPRFMAGGPGNPLGARAMYLGATVYRIHGTNQPSTIGKFVSSGCIGMLNEDVSDLFDRVKVGTRVVVMPAAMPTTTALAQPIPGPNAGYVPSVPAPGAQAAQPIPGTQPTVVPPLPAPVVVR